jgi:PAS domain S-box-containing protein
MNPPAKRKCRSPASIGFSLIILLVSLSIGLLGYLYYAPLQERAWLITIVIGLLTGAACMSAALWWRKKEAELRQQQLTTEDERRSLRERYDYLSKYANDIILLFDGTGAIVEANDKALSSYGFTRPELLSMNIGDIKADESLDRLEDRIAKIRGQNGCVFETLHRRKDGSVFPVEVSSRAIQVEGKNIYQSIIRDISERKQAEQKIHHITRLYAVLSQVNQAIVHAEEQQKLFREICRICGETGGFKMAWIRLIDRETNAAKSVAHYGTGNCYPDRMNISAADEPEGPGPAGRAVRNARYYVSNDISANPRLSSFKTGGQDQRAFGSLAAFPIMSSGFAIGDLNLYSGEAGFFDHDEINLLDEISRDISFAIEHMDREVRRKSAEAELMQEKNRSEAIIAAMGDAISIQDGNFRILYQNDRHRALIGSHIGEYCYKAYESRDSICEGCPIADSYKDGKVHSAERTVSIDGGTRYFEIMSSPLKDAGGLIVAGIEAAREITGRKQMEQCLDESEKRYRLLVESITDYIYTVKVEKGKPVSTIHGPGCLTVTGYSREEYYQDKDLWYRIIHGEDREYVIGRATQILSGQSVSPYEHRIIHKNGSVRWIRNTPVPRFDADGALIDYDGLITDITQLKQLEAQLRQAQKMEAVGQLAGGIAHDFNNILTAIVGYGNLLLLKLSKPDPLRSYAEQILASAERAAHLTRSLLAFSRTQIIDLKSVDLNSIIKRVERLLKRLIGEDIVFKTTLTAETLPVLADSVQIEQVLMNLATNARDAMPDGGILLLETNMLEVDEEFQKRHGYGKPGRYAVIVVTDTGSGMGEKTIGKLFEPFFTTKEVGKGTGLGLAMVYGIVKQHAGYINVYSEKGKGTAFKIYLPLLQSEKPAEMEEKVPAPSPHGLETVLLAEDDEEVRKLTKTVLEDFGYRVIEAENGEQAVRKFIANKDAVDLLVFDIIMPGKNGKEAYREIRKIRPDIRALFMSGYTSDYIVSRGILETGLDLVLKPISPTDFLKKVREALDGK